MSGFESPNYTQTPNDFFAMLPEMGEAEMRVTLVMIRHTFGFHREGFKMGIGKLARAAGLSPQGARDGAAAAEARGTFRRVNPDAITEAEWELSVTLQPVEDPSTRFTLPLQPVEGTPPAGRGQVGVKESIKEKFKEREKPALDFKNMTIPQARKVTTLRMYEDATGWFPADVLWEQVHETITKHNLTADKIRAAAVAWVGKGYKRGNVMGILEWAINGAPADKNAPRPAATEIDPFASLKEHIARQEAAK